jgi:hypothetical protein
MSYIGITLTPTRNPFLPSVSFFLFLSPFYRRVMHAPAFTNPALNPSVWPGTCLHMFRTNRTYHDSLTPMLYKRVNSGVRVEEKFAFKCWISYSVQASASSHCLISIVFTYCFGFFIV